MSQYKKHLPNLLTLSRGVFVVLIALLFYTSLPYKFHLIFILFSIAGISDILDGKLARKWEVKTNFGIVFDSLFDKVLTISMYLFLIPYNLIHPGVFVALVFRDIIIDGIKNYSLSRGRPIPARRSGKNKMVAQTAMIFIALLLLIFPNQSLLSTCLLIAAASALFFSYYSAIIYIYDWLNPND